MAHALNTRIFLSGTPAAGVGGERGGPHFSAFCRGPGRTAAGCQVLVGKSPFHQWPRPTNWCTGPGRNGLILMVGHLERFNSAKEEMKSRVTQPRFIESHRLSFFKERGTDVDVVLDLMIHDLGSCAEHSPPRPFPNPRRVASAPHSRIRVDLANVRAGVRQRLHRQPHRLTYVLQVHAQVPPLPARGLPGGGF